MLNPTERQSIVREEFIYDSAPFPSCHAATLVEAANGDILAAFFGGTHERHPDVCIYTARRTRAGWGAPIAVADGVQADGSRQPTWNPVLFCPKNAPMMLFYKVGPNPRDWWGELKTSDDDGRTWSPARRLPDGILGPIKNKPVQLENGDILSPCSVESIADANDDGLAAAAAAAIATGAVVAGIHGAAARAMTNRPASPKAPPGWWVYFERSTDGGATWTRTPLVHQPDGIKAIQPSLLIHPGGRLQALGRTRSARLFQTWSQDNGQTWDTMKLTDLPNCNSGTDAVSLQHWQQLLVYNHSDTEKVRYPLNVAVSADGTNWQAAAVLETEPPGQYSYPAVIQSRDGMVHVAYTWKRLKMKYMALDPKRFALRPLVAGRWPEA